MESHNGAFEDKNLKQMAKPILVALTGAGISAESGLKTFRDSDGLWNGYAIEEVATPEAFVKNPKLVLDFYNFRRREVLAALPNAAHSELVELEKWFDVRIVTQNVDDLHERAGSSSVLHLHGEIRKMRSVKDENNIYPIEGDIQLGDIAPDGNQLRPYIVWFNEPVPKIEEAIQIAEQADYLVVIGTSLNVYPAAGLVQYVPIGAPLYVIDKKIPRNTLPDHVICIEEKASVGVRILSEMLKDAIR